MERAVFREALRELEPDDREGLINAVQERVRALSSRHLDIQERIETSEENRQDLQTRLQDAERKIVEQADAAVEQDVDSIEDVETLPEDAAVEFDAELLAEVRDIRERARSNYETTAAEGSDLRSELARNGEELELHQEVLAAMEDEDLTTAGARERLLDFFEEAPDGEGGEGATDEEPDGTAGSDGDATDSTAPDDE